jgi:hypothetical protein
MLLRVADARAKGAGGGYKFKAPAGDVNAPDLYIPTLAFATYCLVCCTADIASTPSRFKPEVRLSRAMTHAVLL